MTTNASRPLRTYFALTFGISWTGLLLVTGGRMHASPQELERMLPLAALTLTAGPCVAGLLVGGKGGFRDLLQRLSRWRCDARWYALALLTMPLLMMTICLSLALFSAAFLPPIFSVSDKLSPLLLAIVAGLIGGLAEELGWTGCAIPWLRSQHSTFATGVRVGVVWGVWHFPINVWASPSLCGDVPLHVFIPLYLLVAVAQLTAYRVLMVWLYERTQSLLLAVLMHASLIVSTVQTVLTPPTRGLAFLTWFSLSAALLWVVVAVVAATTASAVPPERAPRST